MTWVTTSQTRSSVISNRRCHHVLHRHHQQHHYRSFHLQILRVQHQGWDPRPSLPRRVRISYRGHDETMMAGIVLPGGSIILISCWKYHSWYNVDRLKYHVDVMFTRKNMTALTLYDIMIYQFIITLFCLNIRHSKMATIYLCSFFPGLRLTQPCKSATILSRSTAHRDPSSVSHCHCHWLSPNDIIQHHISWSSPSSEEPQPSKNCSRANGFFPWPGESHPITVINITTTTTKTRTSKRRSKTLLAL